MADKKISALTAATTPLAGSEVLPIVQSGVTVKVSVDNLTSGKTVPADKFYALSTSTTPVDIRRSVANNTILANVVDSPSLSNANYVLFGVDTTGGSVGYATAGAFVSTGANGTGTARPLILHTYGNNDIVFARQNTAIGSITANGFAPVAGKGIDFSADPSAAGMTSELLDDYEEGTWTPAFVSSGATFGYTTQYGVYTKVGNRVFVNGDIYLSAGATGTLTNALTISGLPFAVSTTSSGYVSFSMGYMETVDVPAGHILVNMAAANNETSIGIIGSAIDNAAPTSWTAAALTGRARIMFFGSYLTA